MAVAAALAGIALIASGGGASSNLLSPWARPGEWSMPSGGAIGSRAVLIDQIGPQMPKPAFRGNVGRLLEDAGYDLVVIQPEQATVNEIRKLPSHKAGLYVLRVHSALVVEGERITEDVALFTSDLVDLSRFAITGLAHAPRSAPTMAPSRLASQHDYSKDELAALIPVRRWSGEDRQPFLGVGGRFVREHMRGQFDDGTVVILMGCDTLRGRALSEAFLMRGATTVIGWSDQVSAGHTDRATEVLLRHLVKGLTVDEALRDVMKTVGPDPTSGAYMVAAVASLHGN